MNAYKEKQKQEKIAKLKENAVAAKGFLATHEAVQALADFAGITKNSAWREVEDARQVARRKGQSCTK